MKRGPNLTLLALIITIGALAIPCVSWFSVGYRDALRRATEIEDEQSRSARQVAVQLAERLRTRLESLRESESRRPYYHYQNLYHDPRGASEGASVVPSPLAQGPADPWIWAYFQIDARGRLTLPTLNEEVNEANQPDEVTSQRKIQKQLEVAAADCLAFIRQGRRPDTLVQTEAQANPPKANTTQSRSDRSSSSYDGKSVPQQKAQPQQRVEVLAPDAYAQNAQAAKVYANIKGGGKDNPRAQIDLGKLSANKQVSIPISLFQWATIHLNHDASLVALREVTTPDQSLVQGFVISLSSVAESLKGTAFPVEFTPNRFVRADSKYISVVTLADPHWAVDVDATQALTRAHSDAQAVWRRFWRSFTWGVVSALIAMLCVVGMVWQTERLARQRSQFAASAAHELRTPLAGLRMYSEMLAEGLGDPSRAKEYARRVADEAERLGRVVANMLGFTRLERGTLKVRPEPGDLAKTVLGCVERQRASMEVMGARVELTIADGLPTIRFDHDAVGEILQNLLDNAEKHTRSAANRTIHVSLSAAANGVSLSVADHGPGVPAEIRSRIFRPFQRGNRTDAPPGLGLGLVLVQALALAHGGNVSYADAPGGGAIFTVTFPA